MKILITGAYGQLGKEISRVIENGSCSVGKIDSVFKNANIIGTSSSELDISCLNDVSKYTKITRPDIIINAAAYTDVDGCEKNPEKAYRVNALGNRNLAIAAANINASILSISTDYVFSGEQRVPYREYDLPSPINIYGKTKLLGEKYLQQFCNKYYIIRTSWLYSSFNNNFVKTIIKLARENKSINIVDDQIGIPTNAEDLTYHILRIILSTGYGIYHCSGIGECSRYDFALKIINNSKIPCLVNRIKSSQLSKPAKRPEYSSLDNMMLRCTIGDRMRYWEDALESFLKQEISAK